MWKIDDILQKDRVAEEMKSRLMALVPVIADIRLFEVGINFNPAATACDVVLYSEFADRNGLQAYQVHPAHLEVKNYILSVVTQSSVVDYEV
jgi:hypothetical protein